MAGTSALTRERARLTQNRCVARLGRLRRVIRPSSSRGRGPRCRFFLVQSLGSRGHCRPLALGGWFAHPRRHCPRRPVIRNGRPSRFYKSRRENVTVITSDTEVKQLAGNARYALDVLRSSLAIILNHSFFGGGGGLQQRWGARPDRGERWFQQRLGLDQQHASLITSEN